MGHALMGSKPPDQNASDTFSLPRALTARLATIRTTEIQQSIEIFSWYCLRHCRPQQRGRNCGSRRQDQKTFPLAESLEKKAGCGGADRSCDGDQGADGPAHYVESAVPVVRSVSTRIVSTVTAAALKPPSN